MKRRFSSRRAIPLELGRCSNTRGAPPAAHAPDRDREGCSPSHVAFPVASSLEPSRPNDRRERQSSVQRPVQAPPRRIREVFCSKRRAGPLVNLMMPVRRRLSLQGILTEGRGVVFAEGWRSPISSGFALPDSSPIGTKHYEEVDCLERRGRPRRSFGM